MLIEILQQTINGLAIGGVYVLIALGLTTVFGILGIAHFAHGSISMFGGYLTFFLVTAKGLPVLAAIPVALVAGILLGCWSRCSPIVLCEMPTISTRSSSPSA